MNVWMFLVWLKVSMVRIGISMLVVRVIRKMLMMKLRICRVGKVMDCGVLGCGGLVILLVVCGE